MSDETDLPYVHGRMGPQRLAPFYFGKAEEALKSVEEAVKADGTLDDADLLPVDLGAGAVYALLAIADEQARTRRAIEEQTKVLQQLVNVQRRPR